MLEGRERDGFGITLVVLRSRVARHYASSQPVDDLDSFSFKSLAVDFYRVIGKLPRRLIVVESAVDLAELAVNIAAYPHPLEQRMGRRIAQGVFVLECNGFA